MIYLLGFVPAPKLIPIVAERKGEVSLPDETYDALRNMEKLVQEKFPELKRASVKLDPTSERIESFRVNDRFSKIRGFLKSQIRRCDSFLVTLRDKLYLHSLLTTTCDEYGVLTFPMNVPDKDSFFYRWNRMAGTLDVKDRHLLRRGDIEQLIDEMSQTASDKAKVVKRLKAARSQIKDSDRLAYDLGRDRIVVRW